VPRATRLFKVHTDAEIAVAAEAKHSAAVGEIMDREVSLHPSAPRAYGHGQRAGENQSANNDNDAS
jgi:hypothetical protein